MTTLANVEAAWTGYQSLLDAEFYQYLLREQNARRLWIFQTVIPGLLQTRQYAETLSRVMRVSDVDEDKLRQRMDARMKRQEILTHPGGPQLRFVIDAAGLERGAPVPSWQQIMHRQLKQLRELDRHPTVRIKILPLDRSLTRDSLCGGFNVVESSARERLVFVEKTEDPSKIITGSVEVSSYLTRFDRLSQAAVDVPQSTLPSSWPA